MVFSTERSPEYAYTPSKNFGPPPSFDFSAANVAYADASILISEQTRKTMPSVTSAVALMLFNRELSWKRAQSLPYFMQTVRNLVQNEDVARQSDNPLPTIGFEIEFPTHIAKKQTDPKNIHYDDLSTAFGFPVNENNTEDTERIRPFLPTFWEEAPYFSYFHETQGRIISELLRARFTPPFSKQLLEKIERSTDPKKALANLVHKYVDHQGLSLHVSIGIPDAVEKTVGFETDYRILGAAIALAFSSQNRLEVEAIGTPLVKLNQGEGSLKTKSPNDARLEFRGLEVLDEDVYTSLEVLQLLSTALFLANSSGEFQDSILNKAWEDHLYDLLDVFPENLHQFDKMTLGDSLAERPNVALLGEAQPKLSHTLKSLLCQTASEIRSHLQSKEYYPSST